MSKRKGRLPRLMAYAGSRRYLTYASLVFSASSSVVSVVPFYYIWLMLKEVLDIMPDYGQAVNVIHNGWMALGFTALSMLLYVTALMCSHLSAFRIAKNIRKAAVAHTMEMPPGSFDMMGSGKVRRTIQDSSAATETYLAHELPDIAGSAVLPVAIAVMLMLFDWRLGLASLVAVAITVAVMMTMTGSEALADSMDRYQGALMNVDKDAVEYVRGISVVKTFQQTVHSFQALKRSIGEYSRFATEYSRWCRSRMVAYFTMLHSVFLFLTVAALSIAGGMDWSRELVLDYLFYVIFTPIVPVLLARVMYASEEGYIVDDAIGRIEALMAMEPLEEPSEPAEPDGYEVRFEDVSFTYPGSEVPAVRGFTLTMPPGTVTALVGPSGSGKSTVGSLACRFWDPQEGRVTVGGRGLAEIGSRRLGEMTAFVLQDNRVFKDTLANNVRIGNPDATDEQVMEALRLAQCSDIVAKMPEGLGTQLGPGGTYLSGGEVQRVAIARMLLKDAPVVVLDEATAFADPENEHLVQKAFENLTRDKTVLIIAHRLTTVRNADRICVLEGGSIKEQGTHDELVSLGGTYSRMWDDYQRALSWKVRGASP